MLDATVSIGITTDTKHEFDDARTVAGVGARVLPQRQRVRQSPGVAGGRRGLFAILCDATAARA